VPDDPTRVAMAAETASGRCGVDADPLRTTAAAPQEVIHASWEAGRTPARVQHPATRREHHAESEPEESVDVDSLSPMSSTSMVSTWPRTNTSPVGVSGIFLTWNDLQYITVAWSPQDATRRRCPAC